LCVFVKTPSKEWLLQQIENEEDTLISAKKRAKKEIEKYNKLLGRQLISIKIEKLKDKIK